MDADLIRELAAHYLERRQDLRDLRISLRDSSARDGALHFRFWSAEGEHVVELRRPDWSATPAAELAAEAAREVVSESITVPQTGVICKQCAELHSRDGCT